MVATKTTMRAPFHNPCTGEVDNQALGHVNSFLSRVLAHISEMIATAKYRPLASIVQMDT